MEKQLINFITLPFSLFNKKIIIDRKNNLNVIQLLKDREIIKETDGKYLLLKTIYLDWDNNLTKVKKNGYLNFDKQGEHIFVNSITEIMTYTLVQNKYEITCIESNVVC